MQPSPCCLRKLPHQINPIMRLLPIATCCRRRLALRRKRRRRSRSPTPARPARSATSAASNTFGSPSHRLAIAAAHRWRLLPCLAIRHKRRSKRGVTRMRHLEDRALRGVFCGAKAVSLRPSLGAAASLESRYGFQKLFDAVGEGNLTVISDVIETSSDCKDFMQAIDGIPLIQVFPVVEQVT